MGGSAVNIFGTTGQTRVVARAYNAGLRTLIL